MLQSKQVEPSKNNLYDLTDFAFAAEVVKDHPRIIKIYEKLLPALYHFAQYQAVWPVITLIEDSKLLAEMQYDHFKQVYDKKGNIQDESSRKSKTPSKK